jgi:hypothetical protein
MPASNLRVATTVALILILAACAAGPSPSSTPASSTAARSSFPTSSPPVPAPTLAGPSPSATPEPTQSPTDPRATEAHRSQIDQQLHESDDGQVATVAQVVRWEAPRSRASRSGLGVTECIAEPADHPRRVVAPVVHTPLPPSVRTHLATAPASTARSLTGRRLDTSVANPWCSTTAARVPPSRAGCLHVRTIHLCHCRAGMWWRPDERHRLLVS